MSALVGTSAPSQVCEWCGKPSTTTRDINGVKVGVCPDHDEMIDRNREAADLHKRRSTLRRRLPGRTGPDLEADNSELERVERRLRELGRLAP